MDEEINRAEADRLLAGTIYLITCHARNGCPRLASMVQRHLQLISRSPEAGELVRDMCRRMACAWENVPCRDEAAGLPTPASSPLH